MNLVWQNSFTFSQTRRLMDRNQAEAAIGKSLKIPHGRQKSQDLLGKGSLTAATCLALSLVVGPWGQSTEPPFIELPALGDSACLVPTSRMLVLEQAQH